MLEHAQKRPRGIITDGVINNIFKVSGSTHYPGKPDTALMAFDFLSFQAVSVV